MFRLVKSLTVRVDVRARLLAWTSVGPLVVALLAGMGCSADPVEEAESSADDLSVDATSPWSSPEACEAAVLSGRKNARPSSTFRAATWNVRYFPNGADPGSGLSRPTNLRWLACGFAWLDADVFVLEEIQANESSQAALNDVVAHLNELTHGRWRADVDGCYRGPNGLHIAFVHDEARVTLADLRSVAWESGARSGNACGVGRRNAWTGRVTTPSGRTMRMIGVHAKSGEDSSSFAARQGALSNLDGIVAESRGSFPDDDVVVTGDFNTMGCSRGCATPIGAASEIDELTGSASAADLRHVPAGRPHTYADDQHTGLLDHVLVSEPLASRTSPRTFVSGLCGELSGPTTRGVSRLRAWNELSDHCPVLVNIADH